MEVLGENLLDFTKHFNNRCIPEKIVKIIMRDSLRRQSYIHLLNSIHTDNKL